MRKDSLELLLALLTAEAGHVKDTLLSLNLFHLVDMLGANFAHRLAGTILLKLKKNKKG